MYTAIRALAHPAHSSAQLQTLLTLFTLPTVEKVDLYASALPDVAAASGEETPHLMLLAQGEFPGIGAAQVVFDSLSLTPSSQSRYSEVRTLLNLAVASRKAFFSDTRAPRTAHLAPGDAVAELQKLAPGQKLEHSTRPRFFALLSPIPEPDIMEFLRPGK